MMGDFLSRVLLLAFGYAYPAYECYKTIELNKPEIGQLIFWCQYWILVALLTVFERLGDCAISWLPLYSEAKLMFFIYLWYPRTKGTTYVYETFFRPYISQHENDIDRNILEFRARAGDMLVVYWQKAATIGQTTFFDILKYVSAQSPSQLSRSRPSQQQSHPQKEPQLQPQQLLPQMPRKQPTTLRRAASVAAGTSVNMQQLEKTHTAPSTPKIRRLLPTKSAPTASTRSAVAATSKPVEDLKSSSGKTKLAAEESPALTSNADVPSSEPSARQIPMAEEDDMSVDEVGIAIEDMEEPDDTPEERPMEEAIRVTRARLRHRIAAVSVTADDRAVN
ncbi:hypothetical protein ABZP36_028953 [Zizania latifolia]